MQDTATTGTTCWASLAHKHLRACSGTAVRLLDKAVHVGRVVQLVANGNVGGQLAVLELLLIAPQLLHALLLPPLLKLGTLLDGCAAN